MASAPAPAKRPPAPWGPFQIPKPLQQLFGHFPLRTLEANELPARSQYLTTSDLPTLYVFASDEDALQGRPSFNPTCLKFQTLLRLAKFPFRTLPSTNHASPTGSLPFLLPPRTGASPTAVAPVSSSALHAYISRHASSSPRATGKKPLPPPPREEAYLALLTPIRNAFLYTLYLDDQNSALLDEWYICPSTASSLVRHALRHQLQQAAAASVLASRGLHTSSGREQIDREAVFTDAREALEALAHVLGESETGWFFGRQNPGELDAGVFGYLHNMLEHFGEDNNEKGRDSLGAMVKSAGEGALERFCERMRRETGWGDL